MLKRFRLKWLKLAALIVFSMMLAGCDFFDFLTYLQNYTAYVLLFLANGSYMAMMNSDGSLLNPIGTPGTFNPVDCARGWTPRAFPGLKPFVNQAASSSYIYFADFNSNSVGVWDFMFGRFLPSIPVGNKPRGIAVSPDGNTIVVANSASASVSIIDANSLQVTATVSLPAGSSPYGVAITPDDKRAYVANYVNPGSIFVIDLTSRTLSSTITAGNQPIHIAMSPDGSLAYVTNFGGNTVSVVDTLTNTITATISGLQSPSAITTSMNGRYIYVTNVVQSGTVTVLDATTYAVAKTITVGALPVALTATPDGRFLFVANLDSAFISQISTQTNTLLRNIPFEKGVQTLVMWQ